MLMRYLIAFVTSLAMIACSKSGNEMARYHEDGRAKPVIAVASVIDSTSFDVPWSLSEELTTRIVDRISREGRIFVVRREPVAYTENPLGTDLGRMKREFPD